jgi:hypothetical protein
MQSLCQPEMAHRKRWELPEQVRSDGLSADPASHDGPSARSGNAPNKSILAVRIKKMPR